MTVSISPHIVVSHCNTSHPKPHASCKSIPQSLQHCPWEAPRRRQIHQWVSREARADRVEYPHLLQHLIGQEMVAKKDKEELEVLEAKMETLEGQGPRGARTLHQSLTRTAGQHRSPHRAKRSAEVSGIA